MDFDRGVTVGIRGDIDRGLEVAEVASRIKPLLGPFTGPFLYLALDLLLYSGWCAQYRDFGALKEICDCSSRNPGLYIMDIRSIQARRRDRSNR